MDFQGGEKGKKKRKEGGRKERKRFSTKIKQNEKKKKEKKKKKKKGGGKGKWNLARNNLVCAKVRDFILSRLLWGVFATTGEENVATRGKKKGEKWKVGSLVAKHAFSISPSSPIVHV